MKNEKRYLLNAYLTFSEVKLDLYSVHRYKSWTCHTHGNPRDKDSHKADKTASIGEELTIDRSAETPKGASSTSEGVIIQSPISTPV